MNTLKSFETLVHLLSIVGDIIAPLAGHPEYGTDIWRIEHKINESREAVHEFYLKLAKDDKDGKRV